MLTTSDYLNQIEKGISELRFPSRPEGLFRPIEYTLENGGKRLRPVLCLAAADACGLPPQMAINQALGLEMFHNFTLLHDDVMDRADMRRGRPTVHCKWNENTAILSGDAMLTAATSLVAMEAGEHLGEVLGLFNLTAMQIYEGQQYDMDYESRQDVTVEEYLSMIRLKTSVLLGCACSMGAIMADATKETREALYDFGAFLGLSFQLRDDYLDTFGDPKVFGKNIGGDIMNDKKTWLLINAMADPEMARWLGKPASSEKIEAVTAIYRRLGLDTKCQEVISAYAAKAIEALSKARLSDEAFTFFKELTGRLSGRTK